MDIGRAMGLRVAILIGAAALAGAAGAASIDPAPAFLASAPVAARQSDPYRAIFAAIRAGEWSVAAAGLDALPNGMLTPIARAELYLATGAPRVDAAALAAAVAAAPDLPQAPALLAMARGRGAIDLPALPVPHDLVRLPGASKRRGAQPIRGDAAGAALAAAVQPLLKANDAAAAEPLVEAAAAILPSDGLAEWRQRVAWAYFSAGNDVDARRVATLAGGGSGEWAVQGDWVAGLAAWRMADYAAAADAFAAVASRARDADTVAAGLFWAARSDRAAGLVDRAAAQLRSASRMGETFYGLLAGAALGQPDALPALDPGASRVDQLPNVRAAAALAEIGETALADRLLRHQARIGPAVDHGALLRVAARLDLPSAQVWLAQYGPAGAAGSIAQRYPMPGWSPAGGWRVDRALLLAHALQESQFRPDAVSPAGARGLMQLMPGTARLVARHKGEPVSPRLDDPGMNFEYGQSYLEELAGDAGTGGLLPKVIAAYNAGPNNVALWNLRRGVQADPLLFIESIPFAETRAYVSIVLRNYWIYQRESGARLDSMIALAQGKWPRFTRAGLRVALRGGSASVVAD